MRTKPYKDIRKARCTRCKSPAVAEWTTCAIGMHRIALCKVCDVQLNRVALRFVVGAEKAETFMRRYEHEALA